MTTNQAKVKTSRRTAIWLMVVSLAPLVLATLFYLFPGYLPWTGTKNHGKLIDPPRPLLPFEAKTNQGEPLLLQDIKGKWTLLYLGTGECDLYCEASLFKARQARLAQGENLHRVQLLYLLPHGESIEKLGPIIDNHSRMTLATLEKNKLDPVLQTFGESPLDKLYLIDPLGNLMMHYPKDANAKGIVKDLKHLLRASRIG
ncbi:MAG: cytochrome oxidase assembly protein [Gammaproteobacteria bacterium]|nr:cytochrome oxidase assembly protein [Gammaproteobacteria bacterium]